jgi:hypothetical protein
MKITAYILIVSLVMFGLNRFIEVMSYSEPQVKLVCHTDCCPSDTDRDQKEESGKDEHSCPPGCDCNCCIQIVALEYRFLTISVLANQTLHYASDCDHYRFDFNTPVFQPPRLG